MSKRIFYIPIVFQVLAVLPACLAAHICRICSAAHLRERLASNLKFFGYSVLAGLVLSVSLLAQASSVSTAAKITKVRFSQQENITRFVVELTTKAPYNWSLKANPWRLDLVINKAVLATTLPVNGLIATLVTAYQLVSTKNQAPTVIHFDLKQPVQVKVYTISATPHYNYRIVVDLQTTSVAAASTPQKQALTTKVADTSLTPQPGKLKSAFSVFDKDQKHKIIVVIDPGHGGKDPGATGPHGIREKDVVLAISKRLQQTLNKQPNFQATLTRDRDVFIPLRQRMDIARSSKADFFVAIHADAAFKNQAVTGASVFALSEHGASSEMARWLASSENKSEEIYGATTIQDKVLRSVLIDLSQTHTIAVSMSIGRTILGALREITQLHYSRVEQAAFVVLKSPDVPSLLIETGFITNTRQEQMLRDPVYQQKMANQIAGGIIQYFRAHPPTKQLVTS